MESTSGTKWKSTCPQTLVWCCFCDKRFENPDLLSRHLDKYKVNWKLYWQLFYSSRNGSACVLCNILHDDRQSLECHFKMVHCIIGPCVKREPEVITLEDGPPEEGSRTVSSEETAAARLPDQPRDLEPNSRGESEQLVIRESVDDIDVLFEISCPDKAGCEARSISTPEPIHRALPCTSSEAELSPITGDLDQVHNNTATVASSCETTGSQANDSPGFPPTGEKPAQVITPHPAFAVLHSDDEVEEIEEGNSDLLSSSNFGENVEMVTETGGGIKNGCKAEAIKIEDDDNATIPSFIGFDRCELQNPSIGLPQTSALPTESEHTRPTAIVNPFDAHEERCLTPEDVPEQNGSSSSPVPPMQSSRRITGQRYASSSPAPLTSSSLGCDLIAVVTEDANDDSDDEVPAPPPVDREDPLRVCATPPHVPGDNAMTQSGYLPNESGGPARNDLPDLGRLTPSKIAAYMNKCIFSARHQSEIEKQLEKKASSETRSPSKETIETASDASMHQWESDSEGQMSVGYTTLKEQTVSVDSKEDREPPSPRLTIISVESLLPNSHDADQGREKYEVAKGCARSQKGTRQSHKSHIETGGKYSVNTRTRKRTLSKNPESDAATPATSSLSIMEKEEHSDTRKKYRCDSAGSGDMQPLHSGTKEVFKQPMQ